MNKILLALAILGAGTAGALTARHATIRLQREASATRESWIVTSQVLADAQSERERLAERIRELKQSLRQAEAACNQNGLWSVLETNRIGHLAPDLREHLLEELGFNWHSSEAFIVVSKETVRDIDMKAIKWWPDVDAWHGRLSGSAVAVLALTPEERSQIETAMERVKTNYKDWVISHTERGEPEDNVLAQYTVQGFPATITTISNNFLTELSGAIGKQRTELIVPDAGVWIKWFGMSDKPTTMILKRFSEGNRQVLKVQVDAAPWEQISNRNFPSAFRPLFPNGWADVAKREGFELPQEPEKK
jgi:hypothetical protein